MARKKIVIRFIPASCMDWPAHIYEQPLHECTLLACFRRQISVNFISYTFIKYRVVEEFDRFVQGSTPEIFV
jgi:hypothetical protein